MVHMQSVQLRNGDGDGFGDHDFHESSLSSITLRVGGRHGELCRALMHVDEKFEQAFIDSRVCAIAASW